MSGNTSKRYPAELKQRAVRMYAEIGPGQDPDWGALARVAELVGISTAATVRKWVRQAEVDQGARVRGQDRGVGTDHEVEAGERRVAPGERDPAGGLGFRRGRARPARSVIVDFIREHADHQSDHGL